MTLDILVQTKVGNLYETDVFQTFQEFPHLLCLQKQELGFYCTLHSSGMGSGGDQKVLVLFSLLLRGEIGYEIKTERRKKLKNTVFV